MLIADLKLAVQDKYGQVPDGKFKRYLAAAVREYSRWNPRILESTITTIANTRTYVLTNLTGIIGVKEVRHYPGASPVNDTRALRERLYIDTHAERYHMWSQRIIDDIEEGELVKATSGYAYYLKATNTLKLADAPQGGETITVIYYASHQLNAAGTAYETVPADDFDIIRDLALAEFYEADSQDMAKTPDYREGAEWETFNKVSGNIADSVDRLRAKVAAKYGATGILDVGP